MILVSVSSIFPFKQCEKMDVDLSAQYVDVKMTVSLVPGILFMHLLHNFELNTMRHKYDGKKYPACNSSQLYHCDV